MMPKLSRSDAGLAALGAVGLAVVFLLYESAFPLALVDLEVTREEAITNATSFLEQQGADLDGFRRAAIFSGDSEALIFLQRTLGNEEAGRWARQEVPVWQWDIRWFKPGQTEEWLASVGVDGQVVAFRHVVEEAAEGANLEENAARGLAEQFLSLRGWDLATLDRVSASADRKDNRTDHVFAWQVRDREIVWRPEDPEAGTGSARVLVRVLGDRVGGYGRFLRIPQEFSREFEHTQSTGAFLAVGSIVLTVLLALVAMGVAIVRYRDGKVNWRVAITYGAIVGLMFSLYTLTAWPEVQFRYQTQIGWGVFLGLMVLGLVLATVFYTVFVLFPTAAGESLARELFPESLRGFAAVARGKLFTPEFGASAMRGYGVAAALMGFFTGFYWFAQRYMGAWLPAEGPYSQIFNNVLPFLTPLTISLVAAISEETIYRLFGISLFKKLTRSTFLALLIPAAIWAFGHSNYPVFPVYIRGIELTIAGMLLGLVFLHYGLVTCIVAHYVIDAVALGMPLVGSGNTSYMISGLVVIGLALLPGLIGLVAGRRPGSPEPIAAAG